MLLFGIAAVVPAWQAALDCRIGFEPLAIDLSAAIDASAVAAVGDAREGSLDILQFPASARRAQQALSLRLQQRAELIAIQAVYFSILAPDFFAMPPPFLMSPQAT